MEGANAVCVGPESDTAGQASSCAGCPNQSACASGETAKKAAKDAEGVGERMADVKHIILVLSGKGGVGKSTVASQLAWTLGRRGHQVGVLDIDICGPSIPRMMGVEDEEVHRSNYGWSPVFASDNIGVMSIGFMLPNRDDAVIWRGPKKTALIKQFLGDVYWGDKLDYLIVDAPPGTSDEHISLAQFLKDSQVDGALIVTTPQEIALLDVRKEISFCKKTKIPVLGVVENMAGFVCPSCSEETEIFPGVEGGARKMAKDMDVPFLQSIPLDPKLLRACENGECFLDTVDAGSASGAAVALNALVDRLTGAATPTDALKPTSSASFGASFHRSLGCFDVFHPSFLLNILAIAPTARKAEIVSAVKLERHVLLDPSLSVTFTTQGLTWCLEAGVGQAWQTVATGTLKEAYSMQELCDSLPDADSETCRVAIQKARALLSGQGKTTQRAVTKYSTTLCAGDFTVEQIDVDMTRVGQETRIAASMLRWLSLKGNVPPAILAAVKQKVGLAHGEAVLADQLPAMLAQASAKDAKGSGNKRRKKLAGKKKKKKTR